MLNLSSSSEWNSKPVECAFLGYKIIQCQERLERASFIEAHALRNAIAILKGIQDDPVFLNEPRIYLTNWVSRHSDETLAIQKIAEAIQEYGEAVSSCRI